MAFSVFILGLIGMTAQAAFLREILATFRGGELTIGVALLFWLLWTSVGSGVIGRITPRITNPGRLFNILLPWYGVLGYIGVMITGNVSFLVRLTPGELVPYDLQFATVALAFLPFNTLGGFLFTLGVKALERRDSPTAGSAYVWEAVGSALAGAIVSFILVNLVNNNLIALLCTLTAFGVTIIWAFRHKSKGCIYLLVLPIVVFAAAHRGSETASRYRYKGQNILRTKDTKYGRLSVTKKGEQITFYSDASTLFSAPDPETSEYIVHIPMLSVDDIQSVLVLGGGPGGIIDEVLKYRTVEQVTCVEIDPGLFELAEQFLDESWKDDPRVETVIADGRAFIENTGRQFDVIIMNMPPPLSGVTNRYYTKDFFKLLTSRLSEHGIVGFQLMGAENYYSDDHAYFLASIRTTLQSVFPSITVLPGLECRFLAGNTPGLVDSLGWEHLMNRREKLGIETNYVREYFLSFTMSPERMNFLTETLDSVPSPSINTDTKPTGYFSRTILQGNLDMSRIIRSIKHVANRRIVISLLVTIVIITALFALIPGKGAFRRTVMAAVMSMGMTEISLEVMAIMAYQSIFGFLYGKIALLTGSYMAGLAAGAFMSTRRVESGYVGTKDLAAIQARISIVPLVWIFVLSLHSVFPGRIPALEASFYILTALSGLVGGLQFPIADSLYRRSLEHTERQLGVIYAVDLAASSAGALITASLIIPVLGMVPVLSFFAVLNILTAGVIWKRAFSVS
ncbi:fused MFS/spermidine synthase [Candidatus Latescibacterota bacterium]